MAKQISHVADAIVMHAERLDTHAVAEASWTEMHAYLGTRAANADPDFYAEGYSDSVGTWEYNLLGLLDRWGTWRHLDWVNAQTQKLQVAPAKVRQQITQALELQRFPADHESTLTGSRHIFVMSTALQPLLLATRPVLKSTGLGPRHGTVVLGKALDKTFLNELVRNTTLTAQLIPVTPNQRTDLAAKPGQFLKNVGDIQTVDQQWLASELHLLDGEAQAIYRLRLTAPRLEYRQGRAMLNNLTVILFAVGISLGAVISWLLNRNFRHQQTLQASQAALRLTNLELEKLANLDGLTLLANRRAFENYLQQEWSRALRNQTPLTLILCDIDYFKHFNDSYGHLAGDACLVQIAHRLKCALKRPSDLAARYGGEEFAIILPETTLAGGKIVAQHLLEQIQELKIEHRNPTDQDQVALQKSAPLDTFVSLSFGVACITPLAQTSSDLLIAKSDQNLYTAKNLGRNQVVAD